MQSAADFSPCRRYRYALHRTWDASKKPAMFVGLNPSTADEVENDPTVTRCINYAKDWGHGGLIMANIFAWRDTDPEAMKAAAEPIGAENDQWLVQLAQRAGVVIAAWGVHGQHLGRADEVQRLLAGRLHYLKLTKDGYPGHPLYLKKTLTPTPWVRDLV
jgi:hypothetical protein